MDLSYILENANRRNPACSPTLDTSSLVAAALLQKQAEVDRQRALIAHRLASLQVPPRASPSDDVIITLLQRQQRLENLRREVRSCSETQTLNILGGPSLLPLGSNTVAPPRQPTSKLEALADILCARAEAPACFTTGSQPGQPQVVDSTSMTHFRKRKGRTGTFPQKLHRLLSDLQLQPGGPEIASFLPHGRGFMIRQPRAFAKHVMPKYFRMSHYSSFQRQLNLYEFQRVTEGVDKGAYYHTLFIQSHPQLSSMMKRNKIKGAKHNDEHSHEEEADEASLA